MSPDKKPQDQGKLLPFNLDTMSGVFPGTRTPVFQRIRLIPISLGSQDDGTWYEVRWEQGPQRLQLVPFRSEGTEQEPLVTIEPEQVDDAFRLIVEQVSGLGWRVQSCGTCAAWQALTVTNVDGLRVGVCTWRAVHDGDPADGVEDKILWQSCMALACEHWQECAGQAVPVAPDVIGDPTDLISSGTPPDTEPGEIQNGGILARLRTWIVQGTGGHPTRKTPEHPRGDVPQPERSGLGAGTEACFVCQGRIANLSALAVESPEGDKQTISIWRCRNCYTLYLNSWVDRWERLDNLETEETYYRIAPSEAMRAIDLIVHTPEGDHPRRRKERNAEREILMSLVAGIRPLSRQVKQGR